MSENSLLRDACWSFLSRDRDEIIEILKTICVKKNTACKVVYKKLNHILPFYCDSVQFFLLCNSILCT